MSLNIKDLSNKSQEETLKNQEAKTLKLFLVRSNHYGYDTYDSFLIACFEQEDANKFHPRTEKDNNIVWDKSKEVWFEEGYDSTHFNTTWADSPDETEVQLIGIYSGPENKPTILMTSFNAG